MAKRRQMDIKAEVKDKIVEMLKDGIDLTSDEVFKTEGYTYAIPTYVIGEDGETEIEVFAEIKITCKNWYATAKTPAYNPVDKENDYKFVVEQREQKAKEVAEKKAKKLAKQQKAKEKTDEKAEG